MTCPGCGGAMTGLPLYGHYGRPIAIDLCHGCNSVWFDEGEDLSLAPGAVVQLFEAMGNAASSARTYCRAPIAVLDAGQLSKTLTELTAAAAKRAALDPTWPLRAEQARRQTELAFAELQRGRGVTPDLDLVEAGLKLFAGIVRADRRRVETGH